jgi:hypothetical protein
MEASVSFGIVLFLLSIFMILVPYYKGERLFELKEFGNKLVISIENYQIENNELPAKIDSLYPKFITLEELELSKSIVKYNLFRRNISGSNLTDNEEQQHEDFFSLTIYEDFMGFYYLSYQRKERKFIFTEG